MKSFGLASKLQRDLFKIDSKFIQPGFQAEYKLDHMKGFYDPSIMHLKFVNGQERQYYLNLSPWKNIMNEMKYINYAIEYERALNGQEDELADEDCF